jgi:hypothetical protein
MTGTGAAQPQRPVRSILVRSASRPDRSECRFGFFIATSFVMVLRRPLESAAFLSIYSATKVQIRWRT